MNHRRRSTAYGFGARSHFICFGVLVAFVENIGVLVEQREGRPIKLEGNPEHPISLGAIDIQTQSEILNFYDPDRLSTVLENGNIATWEQFADVARQALAAQQKPASSCYWASRSPPPCRPAIVSSGTYAW